MRLCLLAPTNLVFLYRIPVERLKFRFPARTFLVSDLAFYGGVCFLPNWGENPSVETGAKCAD
jgi:hypothetical protein